MTSINIKVSFAPGREDEVPRTLQERIDMLLAAAFAELIDEGIIDITINQESAT